MTTRQLRLDAPIFIGGASSSGTSLLARMFSRHPDVYSGQEMSLFNKRALYGDFRTVKRKLAAWLARGLPTDGYSQYFKIISHVEDGLFSHEVLLRCAEEANNLREFADRIQTHCLRESGKIILAEKTPSDVYCFRQLAQLYPNCLLIHAVRDGRDVVCSLMKRGFDSFEATSIWLYNATCGIGCRHLPNYVETRYEELVKDPPAVLRRICERASIAYDPCMLQPAEGERASRFATAGYWKNSTNDQVSQTSIGRHKTELSDADYAVFCCVQLTNTGARQAGTRPFNAFELLQSLGYSAEPPAMKSALLRARFQAARDQFRQNTRLALKAYLPRRPLTRASRPPFDATGAMAVPFEQSSASTDRQNLARSA